jgi:hypothetical protein
VINQRASDARSFLMLNGNAMMKYNNETVMKAIAICFKPYLKPEEALIYMNLGRSQFVRKCEKYGVFKNESGYFDKKELDLILSGGPTKYQSGTNTVKVRMPHATSSRRSEANGA